MQKKKKKNLRGELIEPKTLISKLKFVKQKQLKNCPKPNFHISGNIS